MNYNDRLSASILLKLKVCRKMFQSLLSNTLLTLQHESPFLKCFCKQYFLIIVRIWFLNAWPFHSKLLISSWSPGILRIESMLSCVCKHVSTYIHVYSYVWRLEDNFFSLSSISDHLDFVSESLWPGAHPVGYVDWPGIPRAACLHIPSSRITCIIYMYRNTQVFLKVGSGGWNLYNLMLI